MHSKKKNMQINLKILILIFTLLLSGCSKESCDICNDTQKVECIHCKNEKIDKCAFCNNTRIENCSRCLKNNY